MLDLTFEPPKIKTIAGAKYDWELVIGMEVHAQIASKAKLFSGASTKFGKNQIPMLRSWMLQCRACCR